MKIYNNIPKKLLIPLLFLLQIISVLQAYADMDDYCVFPPFVSQSISPNILIVLDNSGSMCGEAYSGSYDPSQFNNSLYYGYFDGTKNYKYNGSRWEVTAEAMTNGTVANPIANGSFLNWATMRRTEVSKKLLIGGKANPRSPQSGQTVKLDAETGCDRNFDKDYDTSAGNLIYPFVGNYNFANDDGRLGITSLGSGTRFTIRPNADITGLPSGWSEYPVSGAPIAYTKVDETNSDGDDTYIKNVETTDPVVMDFSFTDTVPSGTITVKLYVRAKKVNTDKTRRIRGVLRVGGTNYESSRSDIDDRYDTYSWTWEINPKTNAAWTWDQIKQIAASDNLDGFGLRADSDYSSSSSIRVTQVYFTAEVTNPDGGPYSIIVDQGMVKAEGLIDNLDNEVRFGLTYFNADDAGRVDTYIGYASPVNMITSIHNMVPSTWTPLGETLREMIGYYRQDSPYYSNNPADYSVGDGSMGSPNIFRDPYAYKFTDIDSNLTDMYVPCAKSFVLFLTDGESTMDQSMSGSSTSSPYAACSSTNLKACSGYGGSPNNPSPRFAGTTIGRTYTSNGTDYMVDVAYWARTNDMRPGTCTTTPTSWNQCLPGNQNIFLYPIFMFGTGSSLLKDAAIYGGFDDKNGNNKLDCTTIPGECYKDSDGDGSVESNGEDLPLTYYEGNDGYALEQNIKQAIYDIVKRAASGTAVSVLSSSEGSGANLMQALFYPKRSFKNNTEVSWTSDLMSYWYYLDPYLTALQIREDTVREGASPTPPETPYTLLNLKQDYITNFTYDTSKNQTLAHRWEDTAGTGSILTATDKGTIPIEDARALWRAGFNLWWTNPADRDIFTSLNGTTKLPFTTANSASLDDYLGLTATTAAANSAINYTLGYDCVDAAGDSCVCGTAGCTKAGRTRTVTASVCSARKSPCDNNSDCPSGETCIEQSHVWKMGDIISSTPRIMGPGNLNTFNLPAPYGYNDTSYQLFIKSNDYHERQLVFVGANDGMFHAFNIGKLLQSWTGKNWWEAAKQEGDTGPGGIGTEKYAFIPKNSLPYLQYLSDEDYCHIYMTDGPTSLTDTSINKPSGCTMTDYWDCAKVTTTTPAVSPATGYTVDFAQSSWRTVVIGSMGLGGATCDAAAADADRISTPVTVSSQPAGWSSYFALDVTDQTDPKPMWEFTNADLGVTNVGAGIVKAGGNVKRCTNNDTQTCSIESDCGIATPTPKCVQANGRWFTILASGSTGPITNKEFKGTSDKTLKIFILDLKTGALIRTIDTGISNAFAGSISSSAIDLDKTKPTDSGNYQDDAIYIGYVQNTTQGGILRLVINDDINPANWTWSKVFNDGVIGPVTTSVANLLDRASGKLWLYFAEGRFFYKTDDPSTQRKLYGIQEPCFDATTNTITASCTQLALTDLKNQTTAPATTLTNTQKGWYISLDAAATSKGAERVISNPTPDPLGSIYFLSFAPTSDLCSFGGTTYLWALDYKSGGQVTYTLQGKALIQVSSGEIKELDLSNSFTQNEGRKSVGFYGIPPVGQGIMIISNPSPVRKFMHVQEQ